MSATTTVDFHCHSTHSDGLLNPEEVAAQLAAAGVSYAALTDHDTIAGLETFDRAARRRGVATIPGVEMTVLINGTEAHLLAYGFAPDHPRLLEALAAAQRARPPGSDRTSLHLAGAARENAADNPGARINGRMEIGAAIDLIHEAGGAAFLAHPLVLEPDPERLREIVTTLAERGLDGIEAFYGPYTEAQQARLLALADELGLLVCGGSDLHERRRGQDLPGVKMPTAHWKRFRDAVCCGESGTWSPGAGQMDLPRLRMKRRHFFLHVVMPTLLAIGLFVGAIFGILLPGFERSLLDRKRETIRELARTALSIAEGYHRSAEAGEISREEAEARAVERIEELRYGPEGKDYFWIQDMQPRIIMHPYRPDLNGQDVSEYADPRGTRIFEKFAEVARDQGGGYVDYVWQWKDDPNRLAPKESYVKAFRPWGWVIGTGLYTEDVRAEIARIESNLLRTSAVITAVVALLLLWGLRSSLRLERARSEAEEGLRESTARYRSLVEATTEGTLLVQDGRCRYGNAILLQLIGATQEELELLDLEDILPRIEENARAWEEIERARSEEEDGACGGFEGVLRRRDGALIECVFSLSRMIFARRRALILLVKPVAGGVMGEEAAGAPEERLLRLGEVAESVRAGLLRARATPRGTVLQANRAADRLMRMARPDEGRPATLPDLLGGEEVWVDLLDEAREMGTAERRLHLSGASGLVAVELSATLVRDEAGQPQFVDCVLENVTQQERREAQREALIRRLQGAMLFLHEPVDHVRSATVFCRIGESVGNVARRMSAGGSSAALVESEPGQVVGIFTDRDLRERIIAAGLDLQTPIGRVMTAPVMTVSEQAEIYEALVAMEERGVQHLGLEDHSGRITGVIRHRELLQFPSYGPMVLAREIGNANRAEEVIAAALRAPGLAEALVDSGAPPRRVTRMLTSVCDAACERFIELAQEELGAAPAPFCFLGLGSHGREELTPTSDQDNALIYADEVGGDQEAAEYFVELGRKVCGWLDEAGFPYCRGEIMAQNPRWCRPLSRWREYFTGWIRSAEPLEVLEFIAFFDFRAVYGDRQLSDTLRAHVFDEAAARPAFFAQLAGHVGRFKPPMRLFGRIIAGASPGDGQMVNVKDAMQPIIGFARTYALRERIEETNTLERLAALSEAGELSEAGRDEAATAFGNLMRLRLQYQAAELEAAQEPDNLVAWGELGDVERTLVNQAFAQIVAMQRRVRHDFLGDT